MRPSHTRPRVALTLDTVLDIFKGKRLHELGLDDVRSLLDDTQAEPLHWEAKGVELKPGEVRKQICGYANSHDGGYLILGTRVSGGKWVIDGFLFPDNDPPAWIANVARGVQPYPEGLDTRSIPVSSDQMVAVVWIPPTPTPPCNAHGTVYERVSGKTESVREALRLAQLFDRGDGARKRADASASQIAQEAVLAFGGRNYGEWADRVLFGVGLAATGYEPDIGSRLFTECTDSCRRRAHGLEHRGRFDAEASTVGRCIPRRSVRTRRRHGEPGRTEARTDRAGCGGRFAAWD